MDKIRLPQRHKGTKKALLTLCLCVFVAIFIKAQNTFNFSIKNKTVSQALRQLSETTKTDIAFSESFFSKEKISISKNNTTLNSCLEAILEGQSVAFKFVSKRIIIFKKQKQNFTISGYLTDADSGERLIYANIYANTGSGISTNEYGFYSLTLEEGTVNLNFSYIGYQEQNRELSLKENIELNVALKPAVTLMEIIVVPKYSRDLAMPPTGLSSKKFNIEAINPIPDIGGESDVVRAAAQLPGVQTGSDGLGGLHVRGGDADQNLMLLDGVPIYHSGHLFNLFSIFNSHTIKSARMIRGGFPARYGGRLSSVFDVRLREGNLQKYTASGELGLATGKLAFEGPIRKGKGSFLLAGRTSILEYVNGKFVGQILGRDLEKNNVVSELTFFDINAKANYDFGQNRIYLSYYFGRDVFKDESEMEGEEYENFINWGNQIFAFRWNHLFNQKLFSNTTFTYSNYNYLFENLLEDFDEQDGYVFYGEQSDIKDISLNLDFDYSKSSNQYWKFGGGTMLHRLIPTENLVGGIDDDPNEDIDLKLEDFRDSLVGLEEFEGLESFLYFENDWKITPSTKLNLGIRASSYLSEDFSNFQLEPRLFVAHNLSPKVQLTASATRMVQYLHKAVTTNLNLPDSRWLPPNENQLPEVSWQETLGLEYSPNRTYKFSAEGFYKTLRNQILFNFVATENFGKEYFLGAGNSYGLETMLEKSGRTGGNINYTMSFANRVYEEFNSSETYPFQFDRRHNFNIHFYHKFNKNLRSDVTWSYRTGIPFLPVIADEIVNSEDNLTELISTSEILYGRSAPYHSLNLGIQYSLKTGQLNHHFKAGVTNAYNNDNAHFHRFFIQNGELKQEPVSLIQALPSVSYRIDFN